MGYSQNQKLWYFLAILVFLLGIFVKLYMILSQRFELNKVIDTIQSIEQRYDQNLENVRLPKIAIGFGGCTDYFANAIECFVQMNMSRKSRPGKFDEFISHEIHTLDDLNEEFSTFFDQGAAAERYIHNSRIFDMILNTMFKVSDLSSVLGGNAPVMANRIAQEGATVLLGAKLSQKQVKFLHSNVSAIILASADESEDAHLILEYDIGDIWGDSVAPRANRFIVHRDQHTPYLTGLDEMKEEFGRFNPDLFVLGGLQMMDGYPYPAGEMQNQINRLESFLASIDNKVPIHFEMASFVERDLLLMLKKQVIPFADSMGFNEQELPNLVSILESDSITTVSSSYPKTSHMLDNMRRVWDILVDEGGSSRNKVSRLHLHTLGYQIIMTNKKSSFWRSSRFPVMKASLVANRHTCGNQNIDVERSKLLTDESFSISGIPNSPRVHFNVSNPVSCWDEREVEFCVSPVVVCTKVIRTVGGGDNISSAALLAQLKISD